jgi:hypothetical protein
MTFACWEKKNGGWGEVGETRGGVPDTVTVPITDVYASVAVTHMNVGRDDRGWQRGGPTARPWHAATSLESLSGFLLR